MTQSAVISTVKRHSKWLLPVILLSYFVVGFPDGAFTVSWLGIDAEIPGMTTAHTGWILVGYSVTYTLAGVVLSRLNHWLRLQTIYLIGLIIMALGFLWLSFAPGFTMVLAAITLYGLGTGAAAASMNAYMAKHYTASDNNWMHFFWGIGAAASALIMGLMKGMADWRAGYWVIVIIVKLIVVVVALSIFKRIWIDESVTATTADIGANGDGVIGNPEVVGDVYLTTEAPVETAVEPEALDPDFDSVSDGRYLNSKWHQWLQIATFFFLGGTDYTFVFFTAAVLAQRGHGGAAGFLFPAVYYVSMTLGRLVAGWLARRMREFSIERLALAMSLVGIAVLFFTSNVAGMAILGFGLGPLLPTLVSDSSNIFRPKILPKIVGYELAAFGAGIAVLFFVTSQALHFFSYEMLWPLGLFFILMVALCNEVLKRAGINLANRNRQQVVA